MDIDYKYTWRIRKSAWYIRLYLWVWEAKESEITFCKLWWGYAFMWFGLPIKCLTVGLAHVIIRGCWFIVSVGKGIKYLACKVLPKVEPTLGKPVPAPRGAKQIIYEQSGARTPPIHWVVISEPEPVPDPTISEEQKKRVMHGILTSIENTAAWLSMHTPLKTSLKFLGKGILDTGELIGLLVGGFFCSIALAIVWCGDHIYDFLEWSLPPLARAISVAIFLLIDTIEIVSWPLRKLLWLSWQPAKKCLIIIGRLDSGERVLTWIVIGVGISCWIGAPIAIMGFVFIKAAILHPWVIPIFFGSLGLIAAACLGIATLISLLLKRFFAPKTYQYVIRPTGIGLDRGVQTTAKSTVGLGKIMLIGFKSVKANTCPKVEVED